MKENPANSPEAAAVKKPVYKKWWFWTAIALCIVLTFTLLLTVDYHLLSAFIRLGCRPKDPKLPENYSEITEITQAVYDVDYESEYDNGTMDVYMPKNANGSRPTLIYAHGGYYLGGDKSTVEHYCRQIAAAGYVVASVNYALAPEAKYPVQARQFNEAVAFLVKNRSVYHVDREQVFFGGDSAGAHLASQMGACYTNENLAQRMDIEPALDGKYVKGVILLSGFYDMDTLRDNRFPMANTAMWAFTGKRNYENYSRVSELDVISNITSKYPAAFVSCGDGDKFLPQANLMIAELGNNGVDCEAFLPTNNGKLSHTYAHDFSLPEANDAMAAAIDFMKGHSEFEESEFYNEDVFATFVFSTGDVLRVKLFPEYAPKTVANFVEYAETGFYDGTAIHRVLKGKVIQGGGKYIDENGEYRDKAPTLDPIIGEFSENGYRGTELSHGKGVLAMARASDYNSATSQFFFNAIDNDGYNGLYAAFGVCVNENADEILNRLSSVKTNGDDCPTEPIILYHVIIEYEPK